MVVGSVATFLIQFASVAVLSRLLRPEDFGLVAMVSVFVTLGNLLRDFGMPTAALQAKELSHQQASNLFWMNVALAGSSAVLLAASTPLLVALYSEVRLAVIVPVMAIVILLSGVGAQLQVHLARGLRYRVVVVTDLAAQVAGLGAAIALAAAFAPFGLGYWALVAQNLVTAVVMLASRWALTRWHPLRFRRGHGSAGMFRAGAQYGLAGFLTFLQANMDTVIIGARLGALPLGFYNRGYQMLTAPAGRLMDPLTQVVVPTLNRARAGGRAYEPILLRIQFIVGLAVVWLFSASGGTASRLIPLVLGHGWEPTIRIFQILAIGGSFWVFSNVSYWVFIINEQSRELLRYNLVSKPFVVSCLAIGSMFGIEGVAWGYALGMALSWPLNLVWLARTAQLPSWKFARNGVMILLAGGAGVLACLLVVQRMVAVSPVLVILVGALISAVTMLVVVSLFPFGRREVRGSFELAKLILGRVGE